MGMSQTACQNRRSLRRMLAYRMAAEFDSGECQEIWSISISQFQRMAVSWNCLCHIGKQLAAYTMNGASKITGCLGVDLCIKLSSGINGIFSALRNEKIGRASCRERV